jgi:hypothetical protein
MKFWQTEELAEFGILNLHQRLIYNAYIQSRQEEQSDIILFHKCKFHLNFRKKMCIKCQILGLGI